MSFVIPLLSIEKNQIVGGLGEDQRHLRVIRNSVQPEHGFFMVRHVDNSTPAATFVLSGGIDVAGRWLLGRIRKHSTQPGRFEILIRRARMCYYRAVDSEHELAEELRFLALDGDVEFGQSNGEWISTIDPEFSNLGFNQDRIING